MTVDDMFHDALATLTGQRIRIVDAPTVVNRSPGLYCIWGSVDAWETLGLVLASGAEPLYVGKSESDLLNREVFTHFNASPTRKPATGSSTVRRSFAALLSAELRLQSQARNPQKPADFPNYGLVGNGDRNLTRWMAEYLEITVWEKPDVSEFMLEDVETLMIRRWDPPINISKTPTKRSELKALRGELARDARDRAILAGWRPGTN